MAQQTSHGLFVFVQYTEESESGGKGEGKLRAGNMERTERVMKRIRERSRSCVTLSKKLALRISFSPTRRRGISPPA